MNLPADFKNFIKKEQLFQISDKLFLAVSGGIDSVVLCELCKVAGYQFTIIHCNFQLRGNDSNLDEEFVKALGIKYNSEVLVKRFETEEYAALNKTGIQEAARNLRYDWFSGLVADNKNDHDKKYVLTAHHANDNIETLLMNFFKGTGIKGLQGILPKSGLNNYLVRPLLFARKTAIIGFAEHTGLAHREDVSNLSDKYTRNYFRNKLIPSIQSVFPGVEDNLLHNLDRFHDLEILTTYALNQLTKKILILKEKEVHIPVLKLLKTVAYKTVLYTIIQKYGFTSAQLKDVSGLLESESGKYVDSEKFRILRNRKWLIIAEKNTSVSSIILVDEGLNNLAFAGGSLTFEKIAVPEKISADPKTALLDPAAIEYPLFLRKWKQGDYFYPLGMQKKKKLSRFLIDQKISMNQKQDTWVLESNKRILWIIGLRIDDRFKVTPDTKQLLKINWHSAK